MSIKWLTKSAKRSPPITASISQILYIERYLNWRSLVSAVKARTRYNRWTFAGLLCYTVGNIRNLLTYEIFKTRRTTYNNNIYSKWGIGGYRSHNQYCCWFLDSYRIYMRRYIEEIIMRKANKNNIKTLLPPDFFYFKKKTYKTLDTQLVRAQAY